MKVPLLVVLVGATLVAACAVTPTPSSATPAPSASPSSVVVVPSPSPSPTVPWLALTPLSTAPSPVNSQRACRAADLAVSSLSFGGYAAGTEGFSGTVTLRSSLPCYLPGDPPVSLFGAKGNAIGVAKTGDPQSLPAVLTSPSDAGTVDLLISGWCAVPPLATASVGLPGGDTLRLEIPPPPITQGTLCPGSASYTVSFGVSSAASPSTVAADSLKAVLSTAGLATPGQPYRYTVTLTNPGTTPVKLQPCPAYDEGIKFPGGLSVSYQLNCGATAGVIDPGASISFEMHIAIPASAPSGQFELNWDIEGTDVGAGSPITVP
jgi:hypothetical protein